ncbi:MAG TPA: HAMP domain-containing sensor histidine kinase [Azospirillaceae bacterium]|nr:HAMP domain-containing sensor histidine kinase [Azospirillaceae bacterium]
MRSLSAKLLVLTIAFVMLAEVLIFVPSVARFRRDWLTEKLAAAHLAALAVEAAPQGMVTSELQYRLLGHVGAHAIDLTAPGTRVLMLSGPTPPEPDATIAPRDESPAEAIAAALAVLGTPEERVIRLVGPSPKAPADRVEAVLDEAPLRRAMIAFGARIAGLSIAISLIAAGLVYLSLSRLLVGPMRRITRSMVAFRHAPEDPASVIAPTARADEIGTAERELADMQAALRAALRQRERLAAMGTAVAKINHDLRGILATAALVSEHLEATADPEVRRVTPRLMTAIDRAIALCGQTLSYVRHGTLSLTITAIDPRALVDSVGAEILELARRGHPAGEFAWINRVPEGLALAADHEQLARALANLGRNAFQAGAITVTVAAESESGHLILTVADDGPGLPPRARDHLFEPFTGSARAGGTGLGLAIARDILRAHGGDLRLVETRARGTTFALVLPAPDTVAGPSPRTT